MWYYFSSVIVFVAVMPPMRTLAMYMPLGKDEASQVSPEASSK